MVTAHNKKVMKNSRDIHGQDIPIAKIIAVHDCKDAAKGSVDDAVRLEPVLYFSLNCTVMLRKTLLTDYGLVNGAMGQVIDIIYKEDECPPHNFPEVILCKFPNYSGLGFVELN
ncbi:hypothetical protein FOCC_FOCC017409 [Frankliniella occidentalis]|nr:hypothetical protein FOCC_FOCC017409 [Frankliniella occidentalis]